MLKKFFDILFICLIVLGLSGLVGCASGGGGKTTCTLRTPDERIAFDEFSGTWEDTIYGDVKVNTVYHTNVITCTTEKFKIADYGFLRTADGRHDGSSEGAESTKVGS